MSALSVRINLAGVAKSIHIHLVVQHVGESPAAFGLNFCAQSVNQHFHSLADLVEHRRGCRRCQAAPVEHVV